MVSIANAEYPANASITACNVASSAVALSPQTRSSDHFSRVARSRGNTPSMSPMTAIGRGAARSRTKSHSPRSHTASISTSQRVTIPAARSDTRLRVKPAFTSLRRTRWAGSSMSIMYGIAGWSGRMPPVEENPSGFRSASSTAW